MNEELKAKLQYLKNGSGIHIKKANRGKFTSYCGGHVTSECIARGKRSPNPAIRKRATFAANARKWKHKDGGLMWPTRPLIQRPGYEVSYFWEKPTKRTPTINDLAKFTGGFETFNPNVYQLRTSDGSRLQNLTGYGFADKEALDLANLGKMTKQVADKRLADTLSTHRKLWLELLPETAKLPEEVLLGLTDTSYNGKGVENTIKESPSLVRAIKTYVPGNRKSLEAVVKEMDHSKSAGGWLGVRSAARRAMALGEYDWDWKEVDKHGRQIDSSKYKGPKDYLASPYYGKYQSGGLIYKQYERDPKLSNLVLDTSYDRFPVRSVSIPETKVTVNETPVEEQKREVQQPVVTAPVTTTPRVLQPVVAQIDNTRVEKPFEQKKEEAKTSTGKVYKSSEKKKFQDDMYNAYHRALKKRGLSDKEAFEFAKRLATQDVLESNWGQSSLSKDFNFGGIKDFSGKGIAKDTSEFVNGEMVKVSQPFRKFASIDDYVNYKIDLVGRKWKVFESTPDNYYSLIVSGKQKYATDPNYTSKLNNLHKRIWA